MNKGNIGQRKKGIAFLDLSKTFRDAVQVCMEFGIEYLWIDSLCIIQDDRLDWQTQAPTMGSIYANSYLTIAAHPTENMLGEMDSKADNGCHLHRKIIEIPVRDRLNCPLTVLARQTHDHKQFVGTTIYELSSSYFKRKWCFQERLLAPRILHFLPSEVVYECTAGLQCECNGVTTDAKPSLTEDQIKTVFNQALSGNQKAATCWKNYNIIIAEYARKRVTDPKDTLPAFSSATGLMTPLLGKYYAGLWERFLLCGLQWKSEHYRINVEELCHRHPNYVAPTFSWASRIGGVSWQPFTHEMDDGVTRELDATIVDVQCKPSNPDPFGEVLSGSLTIRANLLSMTQEASGETMIAIPWKLKLIGPGVRFCRADLDAIEDVEKVKS